MWRFQPDQAKLVCIVGDEPKLNSGGYIVNLPDTAHHSKSVFYRRMHVTLLFSHCCICKNTLHCTCARRVVACTTPPVLNSTSTQIIDLLYHLSFRDHLHICLKAEHAGSQSKSLGKGNKVFVCALRTKRGRIGHQVTRQPYLFFARYGLTTTATLSLKTPTVGGCL